MMKRTLFLCLSFCLIFTQCSKEFDTYYERPDWLEAPIYQILEEDGDFSLYLQAVDRTLQKQVLSGAGLYTCFAPNDEAFSAWLTQKGYKSVDEIPQEEVDALVAYSLVYNLFKQENLGSALVSKIWTPGLSYKYKTAYYPTLSREVYQGDTVWVIDVNKVGGYSYSSKSVIAGNNKYLPVYTDAYFNASTPALTAADYNAFYPNSTWTGKNVGPASMVLVSDTTYQHLAENGVVYEVDAVVEPIDKMYDILQKRSEDFSEFLSLLDYKTPDGTYYYKGFSLIDELTEAFQLIYPEKNIDAVYLRGYGGLEFCPISEAFSGEASGSNATQENATTLFIPSNEAMQRFKEKKLLKYFNSLDEVPAEAMTIFLNSQVATNLVWPSFFTTAINSQTEYLNGEGKNGKTLEEFGVKEKIMTSNGIIYVTDSLIKSRYFETVYTEIFLNPLYTWLNTAYANYFNTSLRADLMKSALTGYESERNTILLFEDQLIKEDGIKYDDVNNVFSHDITDGPIRLQRLMRDHIFFGYKDDTITGMLGADLTPEVLNSEGLAAYNKWNYRVNSYGELVRFKNNTIQGIGDVEEGSYATITPIAEYPNGHVLKVDKLMKYSPVETGVNDTAYMDRTMWYYLNKARTENPDVEKFVDYVEVFMKNADGSLLGINASNFYTVLMPNNTAMGKAITAGLLPSSLTVSEEPLAEEKASTNAALRFLQGHFLQGRIIADDNLPIIYPADPQSNDYAQYTMPTILAITDDALGLANEKTQVMAYKRRASATTNSLYFCALDITSGGEVKVKGNPALDPLNTRAYTNHLAVKRAKLTNAEESAHSNRMACKAVLHEVNNYLNFVNQY